MRKFIPKSKVSACLLAADFPAENPRIQTRNYSHTQTLCAISKKIRYHIKIQRTI